ncbi:MAG: hypothetical protein ACO3AV_07605 [Ilumatobacteraceae bacterium]|jgi:hypothetical protein
MDVEASLEAPCAVDVLFSHVDDLGSYPAWVDLVHRADPLPADDGRPCWDVELRARLGPFARSKKLRMVRSVHSPETGVIVFERREVDGRDHSPWVLSVTVTSPSHDSSGSVGSRLDMNLHYGGGLWTGGVLERTLSEQISAGRERLLRMVSARP